MKKLAATFLVLGYMLFSMSMAFAQPLPNTQQPVGPARGVNVQIGQPAAGINPGAGVGTILSNALTIVFVVAALAVLFFLVIGAFKWITSGGEKEAIGKARGTIVNALIGLAILALAFVIVVVVGQVLNIDLMRITALPRLDSCPGGKTDPYTGQCLNILQAPLQR